MEDPNKNKIARGNFMPRNVSSTKVSGWATLLVGATALIASIFYESQILAFLGLGLTFWGIILIYIKNESYVKESLLTSTSISTIATLNRIIKELNFNGKAIYLPPKYLTDPEASIVYIPKDKEKKLPAPEQIQGKEDKLWVKNPNGIVLTPIGDELARLFEKTLETSFTKVDLQYLQQNMPKLLVEDLEIAKNLDISMEENRIHVMIEDSQYQNLTTEAAKYTTLYEKLGCPLSSAIACALAKATGKPITIEKQEIDEENKTISIEYLVMEEEQY